MKKMLLPFRFRRLTTLISALREIIIKKTFMSIFMCMNTYKYINSAAYAQAIRYAFNQPS